jgi:HPt (histidine-containing phosphotransfer) domain-containing protein
MATAFLKDAPERARGIRGATNDGEVATARALAENLGGMAALVTADALAAACGAFVAAASESTSGLAPRLDAVDAALAAVTTDLNRVVRPPETATAAGAPINADTLAQLRASIAVDRLGLGGQLVSMFISEAPLRLEALERAALGQDHQALRSTADDLKNMCNLVGAGRLGAQCEAFDADTPRPAQVATIRAELARARQTLEELLQAGAHA